MYLQAHDEQRQQQRESDEMQRQIEEDTDREILELKNRYERQLRQEKEDNMKLKGDAGIMKKKVIIIWYYVTMATIITPGNYLNNFLQARI